MSATKRELQHALPFAMEPVVYDFAINERGTCADLLEGERGADAAGLLRAARCRRCCGRTGTRSRRSRRAELDKFGAACRTRPELRGMVQTLFDVMLPRGKAEAAADQIAGGIARSSTASTACSTSRSATT